MYPHPFFLRRDMVLPEKVVSLRVHDVRSGERDVQERIHILSFQRPEAAGAGLEPATSSLHPLRADAPWPTGRTGNEKLVCPTRTNKSGLLFFERHGTFLADVQINTVGTNFTE